MLNHIAKLCALEECFMHSYRKVCPSFWIGKKAGELRKLGINVHFMALNLITSSHANILGIYYLPISYLAHDMAITIEVATQALNKLCDIGFCRYDSTSEYIWVIKMAQHQIDAALKAQDKRVKSIQKVYDALPSLPFLADFYQIYHAYFQLKPHPKQNAVEALSKEHQSPFENLSMAFASPTEALNKPQPSLEHSQKQDNDPEKTLLTSAPSIIATFNVKNPSLITYSTQYSIKYTQSTQNYSDIEAHVKPFRSPCDAPAKPSRSREREREREREKERERERERERDLRDLSHIVAPARPVSNISPLVIKNSPKQNQPSPAGGQSPPRAELVRQVFAHWQCTMHHPQAQLDDKRQRLIARALKSGYRVAQLCDAISGCALTPHNIGDNDRGQRYDGLHVILRDGDQIDRFIHNCHYPPKAQSEADRKINANIRVMQEWLAEDETKTINPTGATIHEHT